MEQAENCPDDAGSSPKTGARSTIAARFDGFAELRRYDVVSVSTMSWPSLTIVSPSTSTVARTSGKAKFAWVSFAPPRSVLPLFGWLAILLDPTGQDVGVTTRIRLYTEW